MKKFIKRAVSWLLIYGMVFAEPMQTFAENKTEITETEIMGEIGRAHV